MSSRKDVALKKKRQELSKLDQMNLSNDGKFYDHKRYVSGYRKNITSVFQAIEKGIVDESELQKLWNFCQMAFALMETAPFRQIESAWTTAELLSLQHVDGAYTIVQDPEKQETGRDLKIPKKENA